MRYVYSFLFYLVMPFIFLRLLWRSRRSPQYRQRLGERFGFCGMQLERSIWIHSVSVGETIAAIPLIKAIQKQYPKLPIVVTNMTPTGSARVKAAFGDTVINTYVPYDLPGATARFLKAIRPTIIIIMETELWPNLFAHAQKNKIPVVVTNARLSKKSARGYHRIGFMMRPMFAAIHTLAVQAQADADRFIALGMPRDRIAITGNLKFDIEPAADLPAKSLVLREQLGSNRLIWIAASTHPGEDEIILAAHRLVCEKVKEALLILVPRHPERFQSVATLAEQQGFQVARRSQPGSCRSETNVYIGDTMGEMMLMYSVADVAFVAGSFVTVGGHNMLEPAVLCKPILTGPHLFNFAEVSAMLLQANGMLVVEASDPLANAVIRFFNDAPYRKEVGENAYHVVEKNRGSLQRQLDIIHSVLT